jgi:hypothetical protein
MNKNFTSFTFQLAKTQNGKIKTVNTKKTNEIPSNPKSKSIFISDSHGLSDKN